MDEERRRFATPPATGEYLEIDLALLDPADPDERRILIEAEHPELHTALESGREEIHLGGATINPTLHIAMHEVVANQLWEDNPPEVWQTVQRLLDALPGSWEQRRAIPAERHENRAERRAAARKHRRG